MYPVPLVSGVYDFFGQVNKLSCPIVKNFMKTCLKGYSSLLSTLPYSLIIVQVTL